MSAMWFKVRKKPVEVEAFRWQGENVDGFDLLVTRTADGEEKRRLRIETLEGTMWASVGDVIIRGIKGECYPVKPDIFDATYEVLG